MVMVVLLASSGYCAQIGTPWFYRKLPVPVDDDFEFRICKNQPQLDEDVAVEKLIFLFNNHVEH